MIRRAVTGAAIAAVAGTAWLLPAADASAKGFVGHPGFTRQFGFARHHGLYRRHQQNVWPYSYGYYWPATYPDYTAAIPAMIAPTYTVVPRCTPSVETVTVPAESGGTRQLTIRRCSP